MNEVELRERYVSVYFTLPPFAPAAFIASLKI